MTIDRDRIGRDVKELASRLIDVAKKIHEHPELRFEEHKASAWLAEEAEKDGARVERGLGGMPTSFRARIGQGAPHVAILAEYDALPEIGHACGHNLIAAGGLGGFLLLARQAAGFTGTLDLLGTPAEEGGGGKIKLIDAGAFEGVDAAIMFHPFDRDLLAHPTLANAYVTFRFRGKASHAALAPWDGASALTACLETFRLIDAQRVHFRDGVRVHGFVTEGGQAVNIIPERASAEFSVRAPETVELERVRAIVERCARGAALACGVEVEIDARPGYRNMVNNLALARRFGDHLRSMGRSPREVDPSIGTGSTDMGDVSQVVPSIHPWIAICEPGETTCHQRAFAECAGGPRGHHGMLAAAEALARTAADVLEDAALRGEARREFDAQRS